MLSAILPAAPARRSLLDAPALPWILVALAALALYAPRDLLATIDHLAVRDTDDAMRLVDVRALVEGQGWFDTIQHRFLPPGGVQSHWSRLVDAPLAAGILALSPLVGQRLAEGLVAAFWPALLMALYALMLVRGVGRNFGRRAGLLAAFMALESYGVTVQFTPGRVDHHNLQIVAVVGMGLCLVRPSLGAGLAAGALASLSLAIGLEGLPFIALAGLLLAGEWVLRGRSALAPFLGFGIGLGLASPLLFGVQTAPGLWSRPYCDALSPPWLWLAGGGLAAALLAAACDRHLPTRAARLAPLAAVGLGLGVGFAALFPACLGGPFPGMPDLVRERWLLSVNEMSPLAKFVSQGAFEALAFYAPLLIATLAATWAALRGRPEHRRFFAVAALFLWPGLLLGVTQFRGIYVASGFIPLVAGPALDRALDLARNAAAPLRPRLFAMALSMGLASPVWLAPMLLPELAGASNGASAAGKASCRSHKAIAPLAALTPGTILAPIAMGPATLLYTPHSVVAAPYHRAIPGLLAAIEGLGGGEAELRRHVEALKIDYLVLCPKEPEDSLGPQAAFATLLADGAVAAPWLEPVAVAGTELKVWRVRR